MAVKARIEGHEFDLETLERLLGSDADPQIGHDSDGYYLTSPELEPLFDEGGKLSAAATALLRRANGIARTSDPSFRPVKITGRFSMDDRRHTVVAAGVAELRVRASVAVVGEGTGVTQKAPPPPGPKYARLAKDHPDVAEALSILGKEVTSISLADLYKVYEIVRHNVGGSNAGTATTTLITRGWVSRTDIDAFTNTVNTASISGEDARHARGVPKSSDAMTPHQARSMISNLVVRWLESL